MPRRDAATTSIVLYPAPARTISDKDPPSSIALVTVVPRTISTSGPPSRIAAASASSLRSGWYTTSQLAAFSPSIPLCSNLSAISTFIIKNVHHNGVLLWLALLNNMDQHAVPELWLEPRGLRRHDFVRI